MGYAVYGMSLRSFAPGKLADGKGQALKPLEEAAEAFGAWQRYEEVGAVDADGLRTCMRERVLDECADTVQAVVNLMAALGVTQDELNAALERCDERNRERGRF